LRGTTSNLKILITSGLFPPDIGGPATYVPRIAAALTERGHDVTVVTPHDRGTVCPITNLPYRLVRFYRARALRYANFFVELWRALTTILREARDCDVMLVNGLGLPSSVAARLAGRPMVVKVVGDGAWEIAHNRGWTQLNMDEFQASRGLRIGLFRMMLHAAARQAQAIITPSHYLAHIVKGWGIPDERIGVIYNAPTLPKQNGSTLPATDLPLGFDRGFRLLTVGRLVLHKRIADVIRVIARMNDAKLVVVGDGPHYHSLQALTEDLGLDESVFMTGKLPQNQVWGLMSHYADALVLNSTYEGLPHVLLEAAQFSLPIVATAVGGTLEVIQDGQSGLLVPPDSPDDLLAALRRLQGDPDLRLRLASSGRQLLARFSLERMIEGTERILSEATR
jgi:glycosyltransferase involved in cell wall biosynthesis